MGISPRRVNQVLINLLGANTFISDNRTLCKYLHRVKHRVSQIIRSLLGANIFLKDKIKVREAIRLYLSGMSPVAMSCFVCPNCGEREYGYGLS
jgi:hypothetical protein